MAAEVMDLGTRLWGRYHVPQNVFLVSNNSYAYDEQGVNTGQVGGFKGVLYKL